MEDKTNRHKHFNLYYIFLEDSNNNKMPENSVETVRKNIFEKIFKKIKPNQNKNPLY